MDNVRRDYHSSLPQFAHEEDATKSSLFLFLKPKYQLHLQHSHSFKHLNTIGYSVVFFYYRLNYLHNKTVKSCSIHFTHAQLCPACFILEGENTANKQTENIGEYPWVLCLDLLLPIKFNTGFKILALFYPLFFPEMTKAIHILIHRTPSVFL